jgi:hypothetical protein
MTLKEIFEQAINYQLTFGLDGEYNKIKRAASNVEKIADDYAIEFAEWCDDNYFKNGKGNSNWSASMDWDDNEKFTTKELLEIFKKQL